MKEKWILRHCDVDLWPKVTNFNRVRATAVISYLAKTVSKLVYIAVWSAFCSQTDRRIHTHRQTEVITPPRFPGSVMNFIDKKFVISILSFQMNHSMMSNHSVSEWWITESVITLYTSSSAHYNQSIMYVPDLL